MSATYETIRVEAEGPITTVSLHRPEKLNALNRTLILELTAAFRAIIAGGEARVAILTGSGEKAFAAGADIAEMANLTSVEARRFAAEGHELGALLESAPFPVIAQVQGFALGGGCELALACDFIHAGVKAKFGQPEVNLGVIPGFGGTQRLARRVGIGMARELCFSGKIVDANEALRIGLVNAVHPQEELGAKVKELATLIAAKGPLAVGAAKRVLLKGEDQSLTTANALEVEAFGGLFGSADQREGMSAFVEKRAAAFTGK
jgi:enoyl-CoA hydratase